MSALTRLSHTFRVTHALSRMSHSHSTSFPISDKAGISSTIKHVHEMSRKVQELNRENKELQRTVYDLGLAKTKHERIIEQLQTELLNLKYQLNYYNSNGSKL